MFGFLCLFKYHWQPLALLQTYCYPLSTSDIFQRPIFKLTSPLSLEEKTSFLNVCFLISPKTFLFPNLIYPSPAADNPFPILPSNFSPSPFIKFFFVFQEDSHLMENNLLMITPLYIKGNHLRHAFPG